jgi:ABC-type branched-subunit amino acid transport system substrate-binding protein
MSAAFKGPSAALGSELYRGSMAYFEEINRTGGIGGRKIFLHACDDGYEPGPAIQNTIQLVEKHNVLALYGYVGTPTVTRALPLLKRYGDQSVYLFFPFTGAEPQRRAPYFNYVFNLRASYSQEAAGLVDHFVRLGRKRIGVFYQIDAYGRSGCEGARAALAKHGLKIVGEATYRRGTPFTDNLSLQVEKLIQADPDAIISVGSYAACAAFIRDARDAGLKAPIANVSFVGCDSLLRLLCDHEKSRGGDYTSDLINSQVVPYADDVSLPAVREYRALMDRHKPSPPPELIDPTYRPLPYGFVSFEGFLDAKLLVAILKKTGPPITRDRLRQAAESLEALDLGIGEPISFRADRHQGLDRVYYTVVQDGKYVTLSDWSRWQK